MVFVGNNIAGICQNSKKMEHGCYDQVWSRQDFVDEDPFYIKPGKTPLNAREIASTAVAGCKIPRYRTPATGGSYTSLLILPHSE